MVGKRRLDRARSVEPGETVHLMADVGGHPVLTVVRGEQAPSPDRTVEDPGAPGEDRGP